VYWVPGYPGVQGNVIAGKLARGGSTQKFVGPVPSLAISRQNINTKIKRWVDNQHLVGGVRKLVTGPSPAIKAQLLSINRTQFKVVSGLLTGDNTLRRHLYVMGLSSNSVCRKCSTEEETSIHVLCECKTSHSDTHIWVPSFWTLRMLRI
jgi:hypothetical protein